MRREFTRREAVLLGSVGVLASLAGCSGGGEADGPDAPGGDAGGSGGGGSGGSDSGGGSGAGDSADTGGDGGDAAASVEQAVVGETTALGPLAVTVTRAQRQPTAPLFGPGSAFQAQEGNEYVAVELAIQSDAFVALAIDLMAVAADGETYTSAEQIEQLASPDFGGFPFAPGELRRYRLHFEVPEGEGGALRMLLRTRTLPAETFESVSPLQVDLGAGGAAPALSQAFDLPFETAGATVSHEGIELTVDAFTSPVEVRNRTPDEGNEFLGFTVAVTNGGDRPNPILVALSGFGGLSLVDDAGDDVGDNVPFNGEAMGGRNFDPTNGVAPGESESGVVVAEVPADVSPLYLVWSPPALYWRGDRHRYVWQVR